MGWLLLPSHPEISIQQREETRNLTFQGNFLQYRSLPLIFTRDSARLTSHHSWLCTLILLKYSFFSSVHPQKRSLVLTHSSQISTLALSFPETPDDKYSSQESATHLNSFNFIRQAWNNCSSHRKLLEPWPQLIWTKVPGGPNPWLTTKSFWFPLLRIIRPRKSRKVEQSHHTQKRWETRELGHMHASCNSGSNTHEDPSS